MPSEQSRAPVGPDPAATRPGSAHPGQVLRTASDYTWRLLIVGAGIYVVLRLLGDLLTLVIPFSLALLVTALLRPLMTLLRRRGLPRWLATLIALLTALILIGGILALVITKAIEETPQLATEINRVIPKVEHWLVTGPLHLDRATIGNFSSNLSNEVNKNSSAIASTAVSTGKTVVHVLTGLVIVVFTTVFLVYDGDGIWEFLTRAAPRAARARVDAAGQAAWATLGHYVRGTLVVAVFHGVAIAIVLTVLGVPLVIPLALLVALGSFIPLVGAIVTGVLAVGVAGVSEGLIAAVVVAAVLVADNQVEAHLLQPFVVGRYVRIHPLAIVLALTAGTILFGVFGALIAVPLTACVNSAVRSVLHDPEPDDPVNPERIEAEADAGRNGGPPQARPTTGL
jgi:predicted PurR-regulated permease PerM